ncbi:IclR family transcriptional regulator [Rhodoplanes sp. Z2-YC6860]|uniref:IclR family transcriptional regulator n=1 Tax=Rhodoplanes sp. Z2-YC6860 TaxID=674703 RepID=UPI00078EF471|nr:helix-turn-helix domain-containing protein [Rhodoplanes sp. Z2-YC6860]AMN41385.1 IclR family transcriptional regulator [Rhodoplanes sp. Z2-YC6860]
MKPAPLESNARRGIQSLEIGVRLFQDIHRLGRPATLNEVARLSGMPPSQAHRYCVSLIRTGLLQRDGRGLYGIGPFGFQLSHAEADRGHARVAALAALRELVEQTGETGFLSTWGQTGPTILHVVDAPKPIAIRPTTKGDLPLLNTSAGWVFAAYLEAERLKLLLDAELDAQRRSLKLSAAAIASMRQTFMRRLIDVRRRRLARGAGERHPGLNAFSAPIFDQQGRVVLAITMFGFAATFSSAWDGSISRALQASAAELTRRIGGAPPKAISPSPTARRG